MKTRQPTPHGRILYYQAVNGKIDLPAIRKKQLNVIIEQEYRIADLKAVMQELNKSDCELTIPKYIKTDEKVW